MANAKINRIVIPEHSSSSLCTRNYGGDYSSVQIWVQISSLRTSPQTGEIWHLCDFFDCPDLFSRYCTQVNRWTNFHAVWLKRRVSAQGGALLGLLWRMMSYGWNRPQKLPKMGVSRQFQAKTSKYKNFTISKTINSIKSKFGDNTGTTN